MCTQQFGAYYQLVTAVSKPGNSRGVRGWNDRLVQRSCVIDAAIAWLITHDRMVTGALLIKPKQPLAMFDEGDKPEQAPKAAKHCIPNQVEATEMDKFMMQN